MARYLMLIICFFFSLNTFSQTLQGITLSSYNYSSPRTDFKLLEIPEATDILVIEGGELVKLKGDKVLLSKAAHRKLKEGQSVSFQIGTRSTAKKKFIIMPDLFLTNKVIAHRGAWKHTGAPQNSVASLEKAFELGCAGSEFDVHLTADEVLVLNHDATLQGLKIEESTYEQLKQKPLLNGETIPLLETILKTGMKQNKTRLIVEIKPSAINKARGKKVAEKVVKMVHALQAQAWVDYISFDYDILKTILELDPSAKVAYLNGDANPNQLKTDKFYGADYNFATYKKNPDWIKEAKSLGLTINTWTVNTEDLMDSFLKQGADFITTDEPELLLKKVKAFRSL